MARMQAVAVKKNTVSHPAAMAPMHRQPRLCTVSAAQDAATSASAANHIFEPTFKVME